MQSSKILPILIILGLIFGFLSLIFGLSNKFKQTKRASSSISSTTKEENSEIPPVNTKYVYKNENDNYSTYFPKDFLDIDSNIKYEVDNSSIIFSPLESINNTQAKPNQNQIIYPKIFQNGDSYIDLQYTIESSQLKEEYILNKKQIVPKLIQKVSLFNAYPVINDNQINFLHPSSDRYLFKIPTPFIYEQNNPEVKHNGIKINLECETPNTPLKNCRSFIFTKEITKEGQAWLDDPNRQYPVIIDPFIDGQPCWGIGGYCDTGCVNNGVTSHSVFTTCSIGSSCSGTSCWQTSGSCNAGCTVGTTAVTATAYPGCANNTTVCGESNCWTTSSTCNTGCTVGTTAVTATAYPSCALNTTVCAGDCWGISGACDSGCTAGGYNTTASYTACANNTTPCSGTWAHPSYPAAKCEYTTYSSRTTYSTTANCNAGTSGTTRYYNFGGSPCSPVGTTPCYGPVGCAVTGNYYYAGHCSSTSFHYGSTCSSCAFTATGYTPIVSGTVTNRYTSTGACGAACYKLSTPVTSYTGNGACGAGASGCAGSATRYNSVATCSWVAAKYTPVVGGTGIKMYTGSGACSTNCWALTGGDTTTYTSNGSCGGAASACAGAGTRYSGATKCTWVAAKYTPVTTGTGIKMYTGSGTCGTNCWALTGGDTTTYTGNGTCGAGASACAGAGTRYSGATKCTWVPVYAYNATVAATKYTGSGVRCDEANGTGNCYKLTSGGTSWTGSSLCPTGGTTCAGGATRYNATQCTWYKGAGGGTEIKLDGLMIEGIKFN